MRRKKKAVYKASTTDDKRLQGTLKRLQVSNIPAIEEVSLPVCVRVCACVRWTPNRGASRGSGSSSSSMVTRCLPAGRFACASPGEHVQD